MDQTSAESVKQTIDRVAVAHGRIDVLCMNAGKCQHWSCIRATPACLYKFHVHF